MKTHSSFSRMSKKGTQLMRVRVTENKLKIFPSKDNQYAFVLHFAYRKQILSLSKAVN